jgi:large subunit ribosomal protein L22
MKAYLKSYRQAPRKVRLVANLMKGKTVERAIKELEVLPKRASLPMLKLLLSAVANAKENDGVAQSDLFVKEVRVDQGTILKRFIPKSHGTASPIHKHTSHVMIELIERAEAIEPATKKAPVKEVKEKAVKATKKPAAKSKKLTPKS